ncbi:MAG: CocE/NonD family hydrolase [Marinilabiliales bacterium]|nr:CocE/NonD family hydrolase [Marinilabiliales bacterium]
MAAASNHPALVAVSPQAPVTNWFIGDDFHHNGAFFILDAFSFYSRNGRWIRICRIPNPTTRLHHVQWMFRFMIVTNFTWKQALLPAFSN